MVSRTFFPALGTVRASITKVSTPSSKGRSGGWLTYTGFASSHLIFRCLQVTHPLRTFGYTLLIVRPERSPCEPRDLVGRPRVPAMLETNEDSDDSEPPRWRESAFRY